MVVVVVKAKQIGKKEAKDKLKILKSNIKID